jgi:hypothetical protein
MGWGLVIRDHQGSLKLASHGSIDGIQNPELAEAVAVRQALATAGDKGFTDIVLASDCLPLIQKIQTAGMDRSGVGTVVGDIKRFATMFSLCSFKHVNRLCNGDAHILARCFEPSLCKLFVYVIPEMIRAELYNDVI